MGVLYNILRSQKCFRTAVLRLCEILSVYSFFILFQLIYQHFAVRGFISSLTPCGMPQGVTAYILLIIQ